MSLYFLLFLLLAVGALAEWFLPHYEKQIYVVCLAAMTACVCLRYGQGVDYITYHALYETIPPVIDLSKGYICGFYPEIGWRLLCALFKVLRVPFWVFSMFLGGAEMALLHRFLKKYVPAKTAGLFLMYPVLFLSYLLSGMRQGLAMCIFLGLLLPLYMEKKWGAYVVGVLLAASFHRVGYAWLILPVIYYLPVWFMAAAVGGAFLGGCLLQISVFQEMLLARFPSYHLRQFLQGGELSLFAVGERVISMGILLILYGWVEKRDGDVSGTEKLRLKAYLCGTCFYMLMYGSSYYASRYCVIFKVLECAVLTCLFVDRDKIVKASAAFFFCLTLLLSIKNLNAVIQQTYYYDPDIIKIWNIPYVSVFQKDAILQYYPYEERLKEIYDNNIEDQQLWVIEG